MILLRLRILILTYHLSFTMEDACRYVNRSKSGFYKRLSNESRKHKEEEKVIDCIKEIRKSGINCGSRKMQIYLRRYFDTEVGRDRLFNLMRDNDLQCRYNRPKIRTSNGHRSKYPNLLKSKEIKKFGEAIATDITYIHLPGGRFCYATIISDIKTRMILSQHVSKNLLVEGSMKSLKKVFKKYKLPPGAIHHSDHGVQYTSHEYTSYLQKKGMQISMTGPGKCYDNAQAERIFNTLKHEYGFRKCFDSYRLVQEELALFAKIYNEQRIHAALGYKTPLEEYRSLHETA